MPQPDLATNALLATAPLRWRGGTPADVPEIAQFASYAFDPGFREAWTEPQIAAMVLDPASWLELGCSVRQGNPAIEAFALSRLIFDEVELLLFATSPANRLQGIGKALLAKVCLSSRMRGARRIYLEVRASNKAALTLYQSAGFVAAGRRPAYYRSVAGDSIDAITLALTL